MPNYRIDAMPAGVQQPILYLHNISTIILDANIIFFLDKDRHIIVTAPLPSKIAYAELGNSGGLIDYRIDTLPTVSQQYEIYMHDISTVFANTDVIFFISKGDIKATVPVASRISYALM